VLNVKTPFEAKEALPVLRRLPVVAFESDGIETVFELPTIEEIQALKDSVIIERALARRIATRKVLDEKLFAQKRDQLEKKKDRFGSSATYLSRLAELNYSSGNPEEGIRLAQEAVERSNSADDLHRLGAYLIEAERIEEAVAVFNRCDLEHDAYALLRLAQLALTTSDKRAALECVEAALEVDPLDPNIRMFYGALLLDAHEAEMAIRQFREALVDKPDSSALRLNLAIAHWVLGQKAKAIGEADRSLQLDPLNTRAIYFLTDAVHWLCAKERNCTFNSLSIKVLDRFVSLEESVADVWARIARVSLDEWAESKDEIHLGRADLSLRKQLRIEESPRVWNNLGVVATCRRDLERARKWFSKAYLTSAETDGSGADLYLSNLVSILIDSKQFNKAEKITTSYLSHVADRSTKYYAKIAIQRAVSLEALDRTSEAVGAFQRLYDEKPSDTIARAEILQHLLAHFAARGEDLERLAVYASEMERLLSSEAHSLSREVISRAINNLVFSLLVIGDTEKSEEYVKKLQGAVGTDPYATATYGLYLIKRGQLEAGERAYKRAISISVNKTLKARIRQRMNLEMGRAYKNQNDDKAASKYLLKAQNEPLALQFVKDRAAQLLPPKKS